MDLMGYMIQYLSFMTQQYLVGGWPTPLNKNDGVRQLEWHSIPNWMESMESHNPAMFQSTNQICTGYFMGISYV